MVGIVFYQKENKKWERGGDSAGIGVAGAAEARPHRRAGRSDGRSLPRRERMPLPTQPQV